jgi:hypothetical protein
VQHLDLGAFDEAEFQEPALQLFDADAMVAGMALGADFENDADVARPRLTQASDSSVSPGQDGGDGFDRFGEHVVHQKRT